MYVDDVPILETSRKTLLQQLTMFIGKLTSLGTQINFPNSLLNPSQWLFFLGHWLDLEER